MWSNITSWTFLSIVVTTLIGIGVGVMNTDYVIAKICFSLASGILLIRTAYWLTKEQTITSTTTSYIFIFIVFGLIGLLWYSSILWVESKESKTKIENDVSVPVIKHKPDFKLLLLGGNIFVPNKSTHLTGIILDVRIRNIGETTSIATDWKLVIKVPNKSPLIAQLTSPPKKLSVSGNPNAIFYKTDFQLEKTASSDPLAPNAFPLEGKLLFYIKIPKNEIMNFDTILNLSVEDNTGHEFSVNQRLGDWLSSDEFHN